MNIMRKLWVTNPNNNDNNASSSSHPQPSSSSSQSTSLATMHLRKVYAEYTHTPSDSLLYSLLPLFCKLFNSLPYNELISRFPETSHFTSSISRLLVLELRKRAGNPSTAEAADAIIHYLYDHEREEQTEEQSGSPQQQDSGGGFMLLNTLSLLTTTPTDSEETTDNNNIIATMCNNTLPSTLVKCLYLFFDLPDVKSSEEQESRDLVQKVFVQLLIRLCSHGIVAEELCREDDLALLFSCVSSWCGEGNKSWRKCAGDVLMSVSTHGLGGGGNGGNGGVDVLTYIHNKACVCLCVDNLRRGGLNDKLQQQQQSDEGNDGDKKSYHFLTPTEITESVFTIFCFLKDSAPISNVLLDDFKSSAGYNFITELSLTLESQYLNSTSSTTTSTASAEPLQNLVTLVTSLTTTSHTVLKPNPQNTQTPFTLPNFSIPQPPTTTNTIKNLHAFNTLISLFNKSASFNNTSSSSHSNQQLFLPNLILDSISSLFRADKQNYFIVDSFLPQMADKLLMQSSSSTTSSQGNASVVETQIKYLNLIEFLVFELNFTPCKELIALSRVLKQNTQAPAPHTLMFKLLITKTLIKILKHSGVFKEAYREIGILEVAFATVLGVLGDGKDNTMTTASPQTTHLLNDLRSNLLTLISSLITSSTQNLQIFREHSTFTSLIKLLSDESEEPPNAQVLQILTTCFTSPGGEEEFTHALVYLQRIGKRFVPVILGTFLSCFRESHRARCNFRKAGGFLYLMSLLVGMEGSFGGDGGTEEETDELVTNMRVFQLVFECFGLAMRFEPANAKLFQQEICLPSLTDTIRLLSHVTNTTTLSNPYNLSILEDPTATTTTTTPTKAKTKTPDQRINEFHKIFISNDLKSIATTAPLHISLTLFTYRILHDLALDNFQQPTTSSDPSNGTSSNTSNSTSGDSIIVHSGAVIIMLRLIPSIKCVVAKDTTNINDATLDTCLCQLYCAELVKSLVRSERNQQIMAGVGLCSEIIDRLGEGICDERCVVHSAIQYVFERVGTQALTSGELKKFLRLGNPLNCQETNYSSIEAQLQSSTTPVPLSRVKTLVSMTTPRSSNNQSSAYSPSYSSYSPSFVEFDMSSEGFGCLFVPSIGSMSYSAGGTDFVVQGASLLTGSGIGSSSSSTLGISTWFSIEKFSDPCQDPHPVRLFTLIKESSNGVQRLCLSILISSRDRSLIISTKESGLPPPGIGEWEPSPSPSSSSTQRIASHDLQYESTWTNLIISFHPQSTLTVYINGRLATNTKMDAPSRIKTSSSSSSTYSAFIGTPPMWRKPSKLLWKQGVAHVFEDFSVSQSVAYSVWKLGPTYLGSFQSVRVGADEMGSNKVSSSADPTTLIPEERLTLGLNSIAVSQLTLQKIRKLYSKQDAKLIARQLGLSSHENATPITILHNSTAHLLSTHHYSNTSSSSTSPSQQRPIGGVLVGYLSVRVFSPTPVYKSILAIGGLRILVSLVALSNSSESLYASLKSLVCVLKTTSSTILDRPSAQIIAHVLKQKKSLLSMRVLHLVFSLVDGHHGFAELLSDIDVWVEPDAISDLEKTLYDHIATLATEDPRNLSYMSNCNLLPSLLSRTRIHTHVSLLNAISCLIKTDLPTFAYFITDTIQTEDNRSPPSVEREITEPIAIRNKCLHLLHTLLYTGKTLNTQFCDELITTLGYDFVLLFTSPHLHTTTLTWAIRILMLLLNSSNSNKSKFQSGSATSFTFRNLVLMMSRSVATEHACLGLKRELSKLESSDNNNSTGGGSESPSNRESVSGSNWSKSGTGSISGKSGANCVGGWVRLSYSLSQRLLSDEFEDVSVEVWLVLCALVLSQGVRSTISRETESLTLELIWSYVFPNNSASQSVSGGNSPTTSLYGKVTLCPDAIVTLLTLTRSHIHSNRSTIDIPNTITQFLCYLYSNTPEFQCIFTTVDILSALSLTIIPIESATTSSANNDDVFEDDSLTDNKQVVSMPTNSSSPSKKILLDFLRIIIIDWMNTQGANSKPSQNIVIDTVLEAASTCAVEHAPAIITDFNTRLLGTLLDHLISCDIDRVMGYLNAVAGFLSRLVDKVWVESFDRDAIVVMDFLVGVVNAARVKRTVPPATIDSIYNSLNRIILYILSRKYQDNGTVPTTVATTNPWQIVEVLRKLHSIRTTVFSPHNHATEFFACLTYILIQLENNSEIPLDANSTTRWHVPTSSSPGLTGSSPSIATQISSASTRVWEDVFASKKPTIEELFKVTFPSPDPPPLLQVREMLSDSAHKSWMTYLSNELSGKKSSTATQSWEIHTQLQSKLQKVTGGLRSLAARSTSSVMMRKDLSVDKELGGIGGSGSDLRYKRNLIDGWSDAKRLECVAWRIVGGIKENRRVVERMRECEVVHLRRFVVDSLLPRLERDITRERGVWGRDNIGGSGMGGGTLDKWMLDNCEGPCRMRKKLIKNDNFYIHYPPSTTTTAQSRPPSTSSLIPCSSSTSPCKSPMKSPSAYAYHHQKNALPTSHDSQEYYRRFPPVQLFDYNDAVDYQQGSVVASIEGAAVEAALNRSPLNSTSSADATAQQSNTIKQEDDKEQQAGDSTAADSSVVEETHSTVLFRLIETEHEKISQIFRVAMIQGLDSVEGLLLFGKDHFYLITGFTILTKTREIKDMNYLCNASYEPILPPQCYGNNNVSNKNATATKVPHDCYKLSYEDVREVLKRRYLLQPIALEIFCSDGRNYLLAFPRKIRNVVFGKYTGMCRLGESGTVADGRGSVAGQRRSTSVVEGGSTIGLFSSLIGETSVTQRWVRGEISNFQYLMHLNTLAGRSYNDLMQYPVFPWILANYDTPYLDLSDPKTFRDLSKPMGAQTPGRLVQFVKRYKEWDDPTSETPPYHYGTHYSSAMIVCSYLVRMEPFAQHFLRLQGGHFDLADRMFHSIKEAWTSASRHNMADVKELIPEFFYLPNFLSNSNRFDLGLKQNGTPLDSVILPPWAKNDPREFIRVHRMALECEYVSQHLHEWIDLIFGCRQQGPGAIESVNVFHHLFYEGNVDIYNIEDPLKKNATIGFINNFGQIPKQLFKKPHPIKKVNTFGNRVIGGYGGMLIDNTSGVIMNALPNVGVMNTVGVLVSGSVVGNFVSGVASDKAGSERLFYHAIDCLRPSNTPVKELKGPVGQILPHESNKPTQILAVEQNKQLLSNKYYVSWGFADCSLRICHVDSDRATVVCELTQNVDWNGEIVACAVANEKLIVTGQTNSVISVWEVINPSSSSIPTSQTPSSSQPNSNQTQSPSSSSSSSAPHHHHSIHPTLHLKQNLIGHSDSITSIATSPSYNIILSGSKDKTAIIWDLARLEFTRQLPPHTNAIDAVAINECSGDLATADGSMLHVWDINGSPLATVDTGRGCSVQSTVLCLSFSCYNDWDIENVVVSGGSDGVVRFWSLAFNQVKKTDANMKKVVSCDDDSEDDENSEEEADICADQTSSVVIDDPDKDTDSLLLDNEQDSVSTIQLRNKPAKTRPHHHLTNRNSGSFLTTTSNSSSGSASVRRESLRGSRSEGNLQGAPDKDEDNDTGSFELLNEQEFEGVFRLPPGHEWRRDLVFRGKLSMHTSYARKDNLEPASITAVGVGRDHKQIYIGDARGRVYAWSVSNVGGGGGSGDGGGRADHWVRDEVSDNCTGCSVKFTMTERRHHCRNCGQVFCGKCSHFESEIFRLKILKPVRVCQPCFVNLKGSVVSGAVSSTSNA